MSFDDAALDAWVEAFVERTARQWAPSAPTPVPTARRLRWSGGDYGWYIHTSDTKEMVREAVKNGTQGQIKPPINRKAAEWKNGKPMGETSVHIDVDITEQHAIFYKDGEKDHLESDIVSGKDGHETPFEVF